MLSQNGTQQTQLIQALETDEKQKLRHKCPPILIDWYPKEN